MATKDQLIAMFNNIAKETPWDLKQPMLWGYFFTGKTKEELEKVAPILQAKGYTVVNIYLSDKKGKSHPDLWWLHTEIVEIHTVDSLDRRNQELNKFAVDHGINYDGMDVGPALTNQ